MKKYLVLIVFILCGINFAFAEDAPLKEPPKEPIVVNGEQVEYFEDEKKVVGLGNVKIDYQGMTLTCDKVTFFTETQDAVAEGNVYLKQDKNEFRGKKITYNFLKKQGEIIDPWVHVPPWYGRGENVVQLSEKESQINRGYVTTCSESFPHYRIQSKKIYIYPGDKIVAKHIVAKIGDMPIMYFPSYTHSLKERKTNISIIPGKRNDWGLYLLSAYRYHLSENQRGYLRLDYREKRDLAGGADYYYDTKFFGEGGARFYYMHERMLHREHIWTDRSIGEPTTERQRYRTQLRHKWQIFDDTLLLAEVNQVTDDTFIKDYFEREYDKERNPRTYALLTRTRPWYTISALAQGRINHQEAAVDKLPEVALNIPNLRLWQTNFYFKNESSYANLDKKNKDEAHGPAVNRVDSYNQLSYAMRLLNFLNVMPYTGTRQTYYTRDRLNEEEPIRGIFYTGVSSSTKFYKTSDVHSNLFNLDINRLRHIITPTIDYSYIRQPTMSQDKLPAEFDGIDSIVRQNIVTLGLENKLQTKRKDSADAKLTSVDLARLLITTSYDFKRTPGGEWKNYIADLQLKPYNWLGIETDTTYDPHKNTFTAFNIDLFADGKDKGSLAVGQRFAKNGGNESLLEGFYRVNKNWKIRAYDRYEWTEHVFKEQEYGITRDLHCWEVDINFNDKKGSGKSIWIVFRLKAFPEYPFEFNKSYSRPKIE